MATISLCIIVKDEEQRLADCLQSVQGVVDEIIVLDTGSTDNTVAIAHQFNARVQTFEWIDDFAAARNASLQYATGEWILVLDADEQLVQGADERIKQATQGSDYLVVNLLRQEVGAVQSPYSSVSRLFRNHPKVRFSRPYHAMIDDSVAGILAEEPHWQIAQIPTVMIRHEGYQTEAIAHHNKFERARVAMETFLAHHPEDAYVCSKLGALYVQMGVVEKGRQLLETGLEKSDAITSPDAAIADPAIAYELHYHLGIAYSRQQQFEQAQTHYEKALQQPLLDALKLGAYNNLGTLKQNQGDLASAQGLYEQALAVDPTFAIAHYNLGMTLKAMGQFTGAIAHYQQAIRLNPIHAEAFQNLGVAYLKLGQVPQALIAFREAIALHEKRNPEEAERLQRGLQDMGFGV